MPPSAARPADTPPPTEAVAESAADAQRFVVAAVCFHDPAGRVLTVRKRGTSRFMLPGGKLEPGETAVAAAVREVREEIGLSIGAPTLLGRFTAAAANEPGAVVESTVFTASLPGEPRAVAEIEELRWVHPDDLEAVPLAPLLRDHVLPALAARVAVVGIGAEGWPGVSELSRARVTGAEVVLGGERHLALLPDVPGQVRVPWPRPLRAGLERLLREHAGRRLVVLASGDPLVSGVGSTVVDVLGAARVEVLPAVSSVALARARLGWAAESVAVVSLVGRDPHAVLRELAPGRRVLVLSGDETTPDTVAALLAERGYGPSRLVVLGDLGAPGERVRETTVEAWLRRAPDERAPRLHVLALELSAPTPRPEAASWARRPEAASWARRPEAASWAPGLPDEAFEHDGQLTKRDLRASALARLAPRPGELLWDVGAGAGSVGIEWLRAHPGCRAVAVEADVTRAARVARNAAALGVPVLEVVTGRAPEALEHLAAPDAVFVGGGATAPGLLDECRRRLRPGGRLVVHGVTVETESLLARAYADHGGELTRIAVEHAAPIGGFTGWTPARTVTQWAWTRPLDAEAGR